MANKVLVEVKEGKIKGFLKKSIFSGIEYCTFLGVPYAQPPTGHNRFKDPIKIKPWNDVLNATVEKEGCRQWYLILKDFAGSEDCLYNNIYTPKLPAKEDELKAVIVNIHPGGYVFGSPDPNRYGSAEFVMHHDIVYVTIGYRLHILGFLNLGLKECSGNQGLKDIIMSLEWIKENISVFGGDPNNITLMGSSSGSAIVHNLMLTPRTKGLFHKAILMGMYMFNPTLITNHENATAALQLAKTLGYDGTVENKRKLLSFLRTINIDEIILLKLESLFFNDRIPIFPASPFLPTSDGGKDPVLPVPPNKLIPSTARIPLMIGFCNKESAMVFTNPKYVDMLKNNFYSIITQNVWGWSCDLTSKDLKRIKEQSEKFYFNGESTENAALPDKCDIITDMSLSDVYDSLIDIVSEDLPSSTYVYRFDFEGSAPKVKDALAAKFDSPLKGTIHADDYSYWTLVKDYQKYDGYVLTPSTCAMIEKFTKLLTSFAKTGNPNYEGLNVEWKPTTKTNPCYLRIDEELELIDGKLNGKRMEFWEGLKKEFAKN